MTTPLLEAVPQDPQTMNMLTSIAKSAGLSNVQPGTIGHIVSFEYTHPEYGLSCGKAEYDPCASQILVWGTYNRERKEVDIADTVVAAINDQLRKVAPDAAYTANRYCPTETHVWSGIAPDALVGGN